MGRSPVIKGLAFVAKRSRGGTIWYVYAWRGGPLILRHEGDARPSLTTEALALYQDAVGERGKRPPDTFGRLLQDWHASPEWTNLADSTKRVWRLAVARFRPAWLDAPLKVFDDRRVREKIATWRDEWAHKPRTADLNLQVLSVLLAWGVRRGRLSINVAADHGTLWRGAGRAKIIWTPEERAAFADGEPDHVRDIIDAACLMGLRRADLAAVPLDAFRLHALVWETAKGRGSRTVTMPVYPALRALLDRLRGRYRAPGVRSALVNSYGRSWTPDGLSTTFRRRARAIGVDKTLHDCRGTFATELVRAGATRKMAADLLGWSEGEVDRIIRTYVDLETDVVALGERLTNSDCKPIANRSEG